MNENLITYLVSLAMLLITGIARVLNLLNKNEITGKLGIGSSFFVSIVAGIICGMIANLYLDAVQLQWVAVSVGAWGGEATFDKITEILNNKLGIKNNKDEQD